ncbi:Na+/H+ antiporter subunit E [Lacticigenium naphthae]|uniref:Na+/H+ antiporter subunit E n=1 Tax=Lacticigenium naphthae TaxID=515351 RepID=UPI0004042731|nr:Na+/H+ antiporter subunit E [Lacticigenium naphthae]
MIRLLKKIGKVILWNKSIIFFLVVIWIILFETTSWFMLLSGLTVAVLVVLMTDQFFSKEKYEKKYHLSVNFFLKYSLRLFFEIFKSSIEVIPSIITGSADVQVISYSSDLTDEFLISVLANSITLTPGTVTIQKKGNHLKILTLNLPENHIGEVIPLKLEKILLTYEPILKNKERKYT